MPSPAAAPFVSDPEPRRRIRIAAALVAGAAVAAYATSFGGPFVFDDLPSIVENASIRSLWPLSAVLWPDQAGGVTTSGRPLVNLSLALNHALSGEAVWSYHAVNLTIHVIAALLLLGLVRRTLRTAGLGAQWGGRSLGLATAVALLWAVHPLTTAAVTYVIQRAESLAAMLALATLYAFVRAETAARPGRWRLAAVTAGLAGMACKETMVVVPVLLFLYDRAFLSGSGGLAWRRHGGWHLAMAGTWVLLAALVLTTGGTRGGTAGFGGAVPIGSYVLTQFDAVVRYVGLALWPHPLVLDYGMATVTQLDRVLPQVLLVLGALGVALFAAWRRPAAGFPVLAFFLLLAPSSSVIPIATQTVAEHRMYLPLAALTTMAVLGAAGALGRRAARPGLAVAVALGVATLVRNLDYRSEVAIWADTAAKRPTNARAHNNLGQALDRAGRIEAAVASYDRALALQPKYPETHYNLGVARMRQGDPARAVAHYEAALRYQPDYPEALNNLGNALRQAGRTDEAKARYQEALARRPRFAEAQNNLGNLLLQEGRTAEARRHFERALELRPADGEARYNLGNALAAAGDMTGALASYEEVLRRDPRHSGALVNAGNALLELRRPAEALARYEAALAIAPSLPDAHFNRGAVLLDLGRFAEAVPALESALRLDPAAGHVHRALAHALGETGRLAEAIGHYERYLAGRPDDAEARGELARLRAQRPARP
jgi:tetratricopeptide (TPR) repeat protein